MSLAKITIVVLLVVWFVLVSNCDGWGRRRRRRCTPRDCQVSSWSSWGQCTADQCGQEGSQTRSRTVQSSPSCGGAQCPDLHETRHCYSTVQVNCELSPWSEWSACSTPCGALGIQTSLRHRTVVEQCGGTCTSTFSKTRSCPDISCLNGGTVKDRTCFCKKGYGGNCCEKQGPDKGLLAGIITPCVVVFICFVVVMTYCCKNSD